jgi:hypothetical protein
LLESSGAVKEKGRYSMRVTSKALQEIESAFRDYEREVESSNMTGSTKHTYLLHAENFLRWLKDEFVPGTRKQ